MHDVTSIRVVINDRWTLWKGLCCFGVLEVLYLFLCASRTVRSDAFEGTASHQVARQPFHGQPRRDDVNAGAKDMHLVEKCFIGAKQHRS